MKPGVRKLIIRRVPAKLLPRMKSLQFRAALAGGALLRRLPGSSSRFGPPRRFCPTLAEYAAGCRDGGRASYIALRPNKTIARAPPQSLDGSVHRSFVVEMNRLSPAEGVAVIPEGRVLTDSGQVIAPDDCLISDVSHDGLGDDPAGNQIFLRLKLPPLAHLDESVAVLTTCYSNFFFHWMFDSLPRLRLLAESGVAWDRIIAPRQTRFQRESLELLGLNDKRVISDGGRHIEAARLIVPTMPGLSGNPPRWVCDFLRENFLKHVRRQAQPDRRIYISREREGTRRVVNEAALVELLKRNGFEIFFPEDLSFVEQVELFANARIVMGAHGAGLSNLVFCPKGAAVIELFSPRYVNVCYWALANQLDLRYYYVLGDTKRGRTESKLPLVRDNIEIDPAKVEAILDIVNRQPR